MIELVRLAWKTIWKLDTFPSYSFRDRTSGAMYAGVPTVDFGCECNRADCKVVNKH